MVNICSLENKCILVTGASSGIGRSTAILCSKLGARVIITGRDKERLNNTFNSLEGTGHLQIVADLSKEDDIISLVDSIPNIDGFSNNAGITHVVLVKYIRKSVLDEIVNINAIAPILLTQILIKQNKINKNASIVFTASLSGIYCVHYGESIYAASKGAISGFAKGAALDLAKNGVRVNCVCPGIIETNLFTTNSVLTPEELQEKKKFFPLKRFGEPEDVANSICFFLSDASSWITGANLKIDGGYTLI